MNLPVKPFGNNVKEAAGDTMNPPNNNLETVCSATKFNPNHNSTSDENSVEKRLHVKLADFGLARKFSPAIAGMMGAEIGTQQRQNNNIEVNQDNVIDDVNDETSKFTLDQNKIKKVLRVRIQESPDGAATVSDATEEKKSNENTQPKSANDINEEDDNGDGGQAALCETIKLAARQNHFSQNDDVEANDKNDDDDEENNGQQAETIPISESHIATNTCNTNGSQIVIKKRIGTARYMAPEVIWHPEKRVFLLKNKNYFLEKIGKKRLF